MGSICTNQLEYPVHFSVQLMILLSMPISVCKPENMISKKGIDDIGDDRIPFICSSVKPFLALQSTCRSIWWMSHMVWCKPEGPLCDAYNPTLRIFSRTCLHTMSDNNQTRPKHTTQRPNKHHHHGGGVANPSGGVDLMNTRRLRGGRPCVWFFQGRHQSDLIDSIN